MRPGRELDALVAEKVMGVNKLQGQFVQKVDQVTKTITVGTEWHYPPYSTDIADAWEVVEKIKGGFVLETDHGLPIQWICYFFSSHASKSIGESAPHAICLAALKAVGVEID